MNWNDIKEMVRKELEGANLTEIGHPGCDCPGPPAFYKTWEECTSGSGGVTGCEGCCQGGTKAPDKLKINTDRDVRSGRPKVKRIREASLTADNTKFNIRTGVNKNPTKVGIKIQLEPVTGYLEPNLKDTLEVAIQEKLNTALADYDIQVSKDTDVPRDHVIGFFIPLSQLKSLIVNKLAPKGSEDQEEPKVTAPEPETTAPAASSAPAAPSSPSVPTSASQISKEPLQEALRVRDLNEISKVIYKEDFYGFINAGQNVMRTLEDNGFEPKMAKRYLEHLVKNNII
jgi:hypothetical protein